jgi:hypothetical protein
MRRLRFVFAYSRSRAAPIMASSACADTREAPALNLPLTTRSWRPRSSSGSVISPARRWAIPRGTKMLGRAKRSRPVKEAGATPTIVKTIPLRRKLLPIAERSPAYFCCQKA